MSHKICSAWLKKKKEAIPWFSRMAMGKQFLQINLQIPSGRNKRWVIASGTSPQGDIPPQRRPGHWGGALIPGCPRCQSVTGFPPGGDCRSLGLQRCSPGAPCLTAGTRVSLCCTSSHWPKQSGGEKKKKGFFQNNLQILETGDFVLCTPLLKCSDASCGCEMK